MEHTFKLFVEIGTELLARSKALSLTDKIGEYEIAILDFENIVFVSRSFADELCNITDTFKERVSFINMSKTVEEMITTVSEARRKGREKGNNPPKFYHFDNVKSLSDFILENC